MDTLRKVSFNLSTATNGYIISVYDNEDAEDQMFGGKNTQFIASTPTEAIELLQKALS